MLVFLAAVCSHPDGALAQDVESTREQALLELLEGGAGRKLQALERLNRSWAGYLAPALLELVSLTRSQELRARSLQVLIDNTGQDFGYDLNAWFSWVWKQEFAQPPYYAEFKSRLYAQIDPRFARYFSADHDSEIRLDEIRWGGVRQDGIPPLRGPKMIAAAEADYLDDGDIVFGLEVDGDVRAYPRRILAWHEMFVDVVGGVPVAGVYCTLCGSMILYETNVEGVVHQLGTSGFLYRSNKLMYDKATQSLWSTLWGKPAVGPLVGKGIRLARRSLVTTTWGEWRRRHPQTTVLSLDTGHRRDYSEGAAYRDYFATDELMFSTSQVDKRLANKAEVLGLVFSDSGEPPLAIAAEYARANPLLHERIGDRQFVVLTDKSGAMRAFETANLRFAAWDGVSRLRDTEGGAWVLHEDRLASDEDESLPRLPSHNAFWFGWYGAYTNTRLIY
jgi:hypothetical protein